MRREGVAPVSEAALQERRYLAESGLVIAVVVLQLGLRADPQRAGAAGPGAAG